MIKENDARNSNKRIVVNTISMYVRMVFLTVISMYTVRVVLLELGASDYGVYNVVGGMVSMFSFASGTLTLAAQRYFAYGLAKDDWKVLNRYFSLIMVIFILYIIIVLLIGETLGLWFVSNRMTIESERINAAICVFEFSLFSFALGIIATLFKALLVAEENLKIYSLIAIFEGIMKLVIVYLLGIVPLDKLVFYAFLLFMVNVIVDLIYITYCYKKYRKLKFYFIKDIASYKEVWAYVGWNFIGSIANVCKGQGVNIIVNLFFDTTINAARGIATQVSTAVTSFSQNFLTAVNPQITKSYAVGNKTKFYNMTYSSSKLSFYLMYVISLPLIFNMDYVLSLWLGEIPDYTIAFTSLVLIDAMVSCITDPIYTAVQATGNIRMYQIIVGGASLLNLPVSYIALMISADPIVPFVVSIFITCIMMLGRLLSFRKVSDFSIMLYFRKVLFRVAIVVLMSCLLVINILTVANSFTQLVINVLISIAINGALIWSIGIDRRERLILLDLIKRRTKMIEV